MNNIAQLLTDNVNGATFIGLTTNTTPPLLGGKKNPMKGNVTKVTEGSSVMVFQNKKANGYKNMVNRRLDNEGKGEFKLSPRSWGTRIKDTPFVEHKGKYYLEVIFMSNGETHYEYEGSNIAKEDIVGLKPAVESSQGGLEDKVIIRSFAIDSIKKLVINHNTYEDLYFEIS